MRKNVVCGLIAAIATMAATDGAYAANEVFPDCSTNHGALATLFTSGGTADTEYVIVAGPCDGNFTIKQNNILIHGDFGSVTINGSLGISGASHVILFLLTIQNAASDGVLADGLASVEISNSTIQNNGGIGLHARRGAVIESTGVTITGNSGGVLAEQGSNVLLSGDAVTGPSNNHTVRVSQGSSALIVGSTITADTPFSVDNACAVITAEQNSSVTLTGGNVITNDAAGGEAVILSGGSTLVENNGTPYGFTPASDTINGNGGVSTQSVIELGAAAGPAGVFWNGNIAVSQSSSFKADGADVTVNGTLRLNQGANGYFNFTKGLVNQINLVKCTSTTDHVANPADVLPNVTIGPPPGCALF